MSALIPSYSPSGTLCWALLFRETPYSFLAFPLPLSLLPDAPGCGITTLLRNGIIIITTPQPFLYTSEPPPVVKFFCGIYIRKKCAFIQIAFCLGIRCTQVSPGSLASGNNSLFFFFKFYFYLFCVCRKKGYVTSFLLPAASQAARMGGMAGPSICTPSLEQFRVWDWRKLQSSSC